MAGMSIPPPPSPHVEAAPPRRVPAPGLVEVARIWWDRDVVPVVAWDDAGLAYELVDPDEPTRRLALLTVEEAPDDPRALASVLAEGLASCDFPPTGTRASFGRVRATLRAAGVEVAPVEGP